MCRWIESFKLSREDIRSLVPSYHRNGPKRLYIDPDVQEVIKQAIKEVCRPDRDPDPEISKICAKVKSLIKKKNTERTRENQLRSPSDRTIYRFVGSLDPEKLAELGMHRKRRGPKNDAAEQPPRATRPNERWEFDFTRLDLLVVDAFDRLPIGRPVIAAIRDKYTGYPVAIFISFEPPSYRLVMECLMYALLEKVHVTEEEIYSHTLHRFAALREQTHRPTDATFLPIRTIRVCPICLQEQKCYDRLFWRVHLILYCPSHRVRLLEKCPSCEAPIAANRRIASSCPGCQQAYRTVDPTLLSSTNPFYIGERLLLKALRFTLQEDVLADRALTTSPLSSLPNSSYLSFLHVLMSGLNARFSLS